VYGLCAATSDDWTGAVCCGLPINRHVRPASSHHQDSSNGLHDTLQRALGPELGRRITKVTVCLSQTPSVAYRTRHHYYPFRLCPGSSSARPLSRHAAACRKDSPLAACRSPDGKAGLYTLSPPVPASSTSPSISRQLSPAEPPTATSLTRQPSHLQNGQHRTCPTTTNNNTSTNTANTLRTSHFPTADLRPAPAWCYRSAIATTLEHPYFSIHNQHVPLSQHYSSHSSLRIYHYFRKQGLRWRLRLLDPRILSDLPAFATAPAVTGAVISECFADSRPGLLSVILQLTVTGDFSGAHLAAV
jgi:hypothetical protein